jgi:hypothetical protein
MVSGASHERHRMTPIRIDVLIQLAVQELNCSNRTSYALPGIYHKV